MDKQRKKRKDVEEIGAPGTEYLDGTPEPKKAKRGGYICSKCKQPKRGHICPYSPDSEKKEKRRRSKAADDTPAKRMQQGLPTPQQSQVYSCLLCVEVFSGR